MISSSLDWKNFDWRYFQTLSVSVAKEVYPEYNFDEYLKPGQKQDGIDIIGFNQTTNKFFTIQCKREEKIFLNDLKKILREFCQGTYFEKSSQFLILTSADLQTEILQTFINSSKIELAEEMGIVLDCWDKTILEGKLKDRWDLVSHYFGKDQADSFCNPQLKSYNIQTLKRIENYIPRKLTLNKKSNYSNAKLRFVPVEFFDLKDIFINDRQKTKHICVIGDAYQGKSSYLKQKAYELKEAGQNIQPIFIEIKEHNVQPLESLLDNRYGAWKKIPAKDLILFIDGLDEAPTDKFIEMIKFINEFAIANNSINIVFSCRSLFYHNYNVEDKLTGFDTFTLYSLDEEGIKGFLKKKLGTLFSNFYKDVYHFEIGSLLYHPFYLVHIADEYLNPPHKLPGNKIKVIDGLIQKSIDKSLHRPLRGSDSVKQESQKFINVIESFAFALQLGGVNSFNNSEMQKLFDSDQRLLLQHNSLIVHSREIWSFANALFQEHIAASLLSKMDLEKIISVCTVGTTIKKIKTKWIQTISSLLSILEFNDELFQSILKLIEEDNIELIFEAESSNFSDDLKYSLLQKLLEKCISQNIRPLLVSENKIGLFIQSSSTCSDYLLELLKKNELTERVKMVCCRILQTTSFNDVQKERFLKLVIIELENVKDVNYAADLIQILSSHRIGDKKIIDQLLNIQYLNELHEYRDKLYELIILMELVDEFYLYGLKGLPYLINHNKTISHSGSEYHLQEFLLAAENIKNLLCFLKEFTQEGWSEYFEQYGRHENGFLKRLFDKLAASFEDYPLIIFPIAAFIKDLGKRFLRTEFREVDSFLEKTNSYWLILRLLIDDIFKDNDWQLGSLITHENYDYILFEFEDGNYEMQKLHTCLSGLRYMHKNEIANTFWQLCIDVTEGEILNKYEVERQRSFNEIEKTKRQNDLIYIKSKDDFKAGLEIFFNAYGKRSIPANDLYLDIDGQRADHRKNADSNFIFKYLSNRHRDKAILHLGSCLKELDKGDNFIHFRAQEILDYNYRDEVADKILLPLLEDYYNQLLPTANFQNCQWKEENTYRWLTKEFRLIEIFKKFKFYTPDKYLIEFIWADSSGSRGFRSASLNNSETVSQIVLQNLSEEGKYNLRKKVVENISAGIKLETVLGTHLSLCQHLKIHEAKDVILKCIPDIDSEFTTKVDAVDIYIDLDGDIRSILSLYKNSTNFNSHFFYHLTTTLYKVYPNEVCSIASPALSSTDTSTETKVGIAHILVEIGVFEAFAYLVNEIRVKLVSPEGFRRGHPVQNIDTVKALKELEDLTYLIIDKEYSATFSPDSIRYIILDWLNGFASKSEDDLKLVITFFENARENLKNKYQEANDFNFYINRVLEAFRSSEKAAKSLKDIRKLISMVEG